MLFYTVNPPLHFIYRNICLVTKTVKYLLDFGAILCIKVITVLYSYHFLESFRILVI